MSQPVTFRRRAVSEMETPKPAAVGRAARRFMGKRQWAVDDFTPMEETRDRGRRIRLHTLANLHRYLDQFADSVERNGGQVLWAADAAEANRLIAEGAGVLCDVEDLLVLLDISRTTLPLQDLPAGADLPAPVDDATAVAILDAFDWMPATLEMLASRTGLDLGELAWHLENLSASGLLARRGLWYERSGEAPVAAGRAG